MSIKTGVYLVSTIKINLHTLCLLLLDIYEFLSMLSHATQKQKQQHCGKLKLLIESYAFPIPDIMLWHEQYVLPTASTSSVLATAWCVK
jgi:hypothetical protein